MTNMFRNSPARSPLIVMLVALGLAGFMAFSISSVVYADGEEYIRYSETDIRIQGGILAQAGRLDRITTGDGSERYRGDVSLRPEPGIRLSGDPNGICDYSLTIEVRGDQVFVQFIGAADNGTQGGCQSPDLATNGQNISRFFSNGVTLVNSTGTTPPPAEDVPAPIPTDGTPPLGCPQSSAPLPNPPDRCKNIPKGCPGSVPDSRDRILDEPCPFTAFSGFVCPEFYRANPDTGLCEANPNADGTCPGEGRVIRDPQNPEGQPVCRLGGTIYQVGDDPKCAIVGFGPVRCPINDPVIVPLSAGCYVLDHNSPNVAERVYKEASCSNPAFNGVLNVNCPPDTPLIVREGSCAFADCTVNCNLVKKYIDPAIKVLTALIGIGVTAAIIWGAIRYSRSANDPQEVTEAKRIITAALLTLVGFLLFSRFLNWIVPGGIGL